MCFGLRGKYCRKSCREAEAAGETVDEELAQYKHKVPFGLPNSNKQLRFSIELYIDFIK